MKYKVNKEIVITPTEFAVGITEAPMPPARKKMRADLADEAEIHAFLGGLRSVFRGQSQGVSVSPSLRCSTRS